MATVTCTPAAPIAVVSACRIDVADADANDASNWDPDEYPSMPQLTYYLEATASGEDALRSHVFAPNGGAHQWNNLIFPAAGSWTVALRDASDDSSVASVGVTVS
jgi:hypothetical protein